MGASSNIIGCSVKCVRTQPLLGRSLVALSFIHIGSPPLLLVAALVPRRHSRSAPAMRGVSMVRRWKHTTSYDHERLIPQDATCMLIEPFSRGARRHVMEHVWCAFGWPIGTFWPVKRLVNGDGTGYAKFLPLRAQQMDVSWPPC